ncbi:hypothetical protein BaRGS_00035847 [Batillaria attramentaria]|uniref:Uncharacterized protein n=1 Tax=Batillaria attramentaria TaxID=370345 RepID=A0ABD0JEU1_9CAEN
MCGSYRYPRLGDARQLGKKTLPPPAGRKYPLTLTKSLKPALTIEKASLRILQRGQSNRLPDQSWCRSSFRNIDLPNEALEEPVPSDGPDNFALVSVLIPVS